MRLELEAGERFSFHISHFTFVIFHWFHRLGRSKPTSGHDKAVDPLVRLAQSEVGGVNKAARQATVAINEK
jgi:hypothetical protein